MSAGGTSTILGLDDNEAARGGGPKYGENRITIATPTFGVSAIL